MIADSASNPVLVYDGECNFCRRSVDRIRRRDRQALFEYVPRQTPGVEERFPRLAEGDFNTGVRLIEPDGSIHVGADAIYRVARRLSPWRFVAWIYRVPILTQIFRWMYAWVARNRYRLAGRCESGSCAIPGASAADESARG